MNKRQSLIVAAIVAIALAVAAGVLFFTRPAFLYSVLPLSRTVILTPAEGETVTTRPLHITGTSVPGHSVYVYGAEESCVKIDSVALGGGAVKEDGTFDIALGFMPSGETRIKVLSVSEQEELKHKNLCYPESFFSKPVTFTYIGEEFAPVITE